jgi:hypothetical protein
LVDQIDRGEWGHDLTLVVGCDRAFLPGFAGLFNSALLNGFQGRAILLVPDDIDAASVPRHPRLDVVTYRAARGLFQPAQKLASLADLKPGKYLLLDADFIIERPCGGLVAALGAGLLVSTEPEPKYDDYDVLVHHQCAALGFTADLPPYPYVNAGLLGFVLPRDAGFLREYADLTAAHLQGVRGVGDHPFFKFPEQDILNILVRRARAAGRAVLSISPKVLELGAYHDSMHDRPFPHTKQRDLRPPDRVKYFIHGASLRRPWLSRPPGGGTRARLIAMTEPLGVPAMFRRLRGRLHSYERAWAYYACSEDRPIPISTWADPDQFHGHRHWLWRKAHGL